MATKSRTAKPSKSAKPKRAASAPKPKRSKSTPKPNGGKSAAKPKPTAKRAPRRVEFVSIAKRATELVVAWPKSTPKSKRTGSDGKPAKISARAPISANQIGMVADFIGKRKPETVVRDLVFGAETGSGKSASAAVKIATDYASGKIGRTDLPNGVGSRLSEYAASCGGDVPPTVHKINGRAIAAVLVALATVKRDK